MESIIVYIHGISKLTWLTIGILALVSVLHALSLRQIIKWTFRSHLWVMGSLWSVVVLMAVYLAISLPRINYHSQLLPMIGVILLVVGLITATYHEFLLGWQRSMGARFFEMDNSTAVNWITKGLYRFLKNPMYDGFLLFFVGLYLLKGQPDYLVLTISSLLLLNIFLARIENKR